jgi:hypothetical protein
MKNWLVVFLASYSVCVFGQAASASCLDCGGGCGSPSYGDPCAMTSPGCCDSPNAGYGQQSNCCGGCYRYVWVPKSQVASMASATYAMPTMSMPTVNTDCGCASTEMAQPTIVQNSVRHVYRPIPGAETRVGSNGETLTLGRYIGTYRNDGTQGSSPYKVYLEGSGTIENTDPSGMYQDPSKVGTTRWIPLRTGDGSENVQATHQQPIQSSSGNVRHVYRPMPNGETRTGANGETLTLGTYVGSYHEGEGNSGTHAVLDETTNTIKTTDREALFQDPSKVGSTRWIPLRYQPPQDGAAPPNALQAPKDDMGSTTRRQRGWIVYSANGKPTLLSQRPTRKDLKVYPVTLVKDGRKILSIAWDDANQPEAAQREIAWVRLIK